MGMGNFSRATVNAKPDKNQQQLLCKQLNCHADRQTQRERKRKQQTVLQRQAQAGVDSSSGKQGAVCRPRRGTYARPGDARQIVAHTCRQGHATDTVTRTDTHTETDADAGTQVSKIKRKADSRCCFPYSSYSSSSLFLFSSTFSCCCRCTLYCCFSFNLCPWLFLLMFSAVLL